MALPIDLLIEPGWIIPIEPPDTVLEGHALAVDKGRILALLPVAEALARYSPAEYLRLPGEALLPGLVNTHTHAAMTLLRGYADDLPLMRWLEDRVWPAERTHVSPAFIRDGTLLAAWEMLRGGVTCFNDMYFFPDAAAEAARMAGIRAVLGVAVLEFPTAYANDADDYLAKGLAARDAWKDEPLVSFAMAPHAPYTVSDRTFEQVATLAAQLDLPIHIHLHETRAEIEESLVRHGIRPLERLRRLGLLAQNLIAVHAVHLDSHEISQLASSGCFVAHCPTSNLKLASGIAPISDLLAGGVRVGIGTDGAASNNRLDMLREMRQATLLAKVASGNAADVPAHRVLRMATLDGAAALGLESAIGSLVPGKWADLCSIRLNDWYSQPCFDPASHVVHVAGREQVSHVWVAGKPRIRNGRPVGVSDDTLSSLGNSWHNRLS
ncbi:MAG: TRZ/ATZ family hydrolase [Gammaproteobacteria bacterium]|nr:TRZ/ATZ family hydrolase [Gammaproteobacteria bacterium]MBU1415569.1 TRZ/ATZ family hydrolase [Gammaproteobacteria bacterium]